MFFGVVDISSMGDWLGIDLIMIKVIFYGAIMIIGVGGIEISVLDELVVNDGVDMFLIGVFL